MPENSTYGGSFYGSYPQNTGYSYVGGYQNLPQGISNAGSGSNNAYTGAVQDTSLVSNQLNGLLSQGSPYIDQARMAGANQANARGALNSSMAAGNSQAAAIQAALPIAQQDASTYNNQQLANQAALNQILQQRMQNQASMYGADAASGASRYATEMNNRGALARQREQLAYGGEQAGLNRGFQQYMSQLGYQQGLGLNAFSLAGNMMMNNQNFRNNIGQQALTNQFLLQDPNALNGYMDWIGSGYDSSINDLLGYSFGGGGY